MPAKKLILASIVAILLFGGFVLSRRPVSVVSVINEPDADSTLALYGRITISQELPSALEVDGIRFFVTDHSTAAPTTPLFLHVQSSSGQELRTINTTLEQVLRSDVIEYHGAESSFKTTGPTLYFPFEVITRYTAPLTFAIEAPTLTKQDALLLRYEVDDTKYAGDLKYNNHIKQGNLGLIVQERPTVAALMSRWLLLPSNRLIWPALVLMLLGGVGMYFVKKNPSSLPTPLFWQVAWRSVSWRPLLLFGGIVAAFVLFVHWPASEQFFFSDDIPILARVKMFTASQPALLLTSHDYLSNETPGKFHFHFYRPLTFSLYPWLMYSLFGTNSFPYYVINVVLFALCAVLLLLWSQLLLRHWLAATAAAMLWSVVASKISLTYWWSSVQDILAMLAIVTTLIAYTRLRVTGRKTWWWMYVGSFAIALVSKEHMLLAPAVLGLVIWLFETPRPKWRLLFTTFSRYLAPLVLIAGAFLAIRTIAVGDPTLPHVANTDYTYQVALSPQILAKNILVYSAWSAENYLWPTDIPQFRGLEAYLTRTLVHVQQLQAPLYPSVLLLGLYGTLLLLTWRYRTQRAYVLFAGWWWLLFLLPVLLLPEEWTNRWLSLSSWGVAFLLAWLCVALTKPWPKASQFFCVVMCLLLLGYGLNLTKVSAEDEKYRQASVYYRTAVDRLHTAEANAEAPTTVYLIGVEPTELSEYFLRLFTKKPYEHIVYQSMPPTTINAHNIIIDMRDYKE